MMIRKVLLGVLFAAGVLPLAAQSLEDLNIQIHGYATQGFFYSNHNNLLTTSSSDGSPAWTEAVVNITSQPTPKLRIGVQGRYSLLGNLGNAITLDWASADYKVNDKFGVRFGKVKTPIALFNEIQDIDPSYIWALLPQGVYPIESRNTLLAHYGGVVYGTLALGSKLGKLEYRAFGGERSVPGTDGYFLYLTESGLTLPNGISGETYGGALHWRTPIPGLMIGASDMQDTKWSALVTTTVQVEPGVFVPMTGTLTINPLNEYYYFGKYEKNKVMFAAEYNRLAATVPVALSSGLTGPLPVQTDTTDQRSWYAMASYKVTEKLTVGAYHSQFFDRQVSPGPSRYSKDWAISARYDFNQYMYAKVEQHIIQGIGLNIDTTLNPTTPTTNFLFTVVKLGVSF